MKGSVETVYVVDDDADARASAEALVGSLGLRCEGFCSAEDFLKRFEASWRGCAVIDICLPGMSGLSVQQHLLDSGSSLPVVLVGARVTVAEVVEGMQNGAVTLLEKPCRGDELEHAIHAGLETCRERFARETESRAFQRRLEALTPRERAVMQDVLADMPNRMIAKQLSISIRTAARLRAAVFDKLRVMSATQLAYVVARHGLPLDFPLPDQAGYRFSSRSA